MTYQIIYDNRAVKFLHGLPRVSQERVLRKLQDAAERPRLYFTRLAGLEGVRLRIGSLRAIGTIDHVDRVIHVHVIGHRENIYDR